MNWLKVLYSFLIILGENKYSVTATAGHCPLDGCKICRNERLECINFTPFTPEDVDIVQNLQLTSITEVYLWSNRRVDQNASWNESMDSAFDFYSDRTYSTGQKSWTDAVGNDTKNLLQNISIGEFLELNITYISKDDFEMLTFLTKLSLAGNKIQEIDGGTFPPNLVELSLAGNKIQEIDGGTFPPNLVELSLTGNNIQEIGEGTFPPNLVELDLSGNNIHSLFNGVLPASLSELDLSGNNIHSLFNSGLPARLSELDLSGNNIDSIHIGDLPASLSELDLSDNDIRRIEEGAIPPNLSKLWTDDPFICCYLNKGFAKCIAPPSPFSTCDGILYSWLVKVSAWIVGIVALVTNLMVLIGRKTNKILTTTTSNPTENIFLTNLAVADLLMGVYLTAIAIADTWFGPAYFRHSQMWRTGPTCGFIGLIGVLSIIFSLFDLTIMTIDRFLCIVFPFGKIRFNRKWSKIVCRIIWFIGLAIALLPIFLQKTIQNFYGYTDVCLGLPVVSIPKDIMSSSELVGDLLTTVEYTESDERDTWVYSSILYTYFASFCLSVVAMCYICMFILLLKPGRIRNRPSQSNDEVRLVTTMSVIVGTDMLCWLPIITLSVLSQSGIKIPTEVNHWLVAFVIPINSAMNPFIYSYGILKRRTNNVPSGIVQDPKERRRASRSRLNTSGV